MRAGDGLLRRRLLQAVAALALQGLVGGAAAIDNPEAPDRVGAFERRAAPLEQQLAATDGGSAAVRAERDYASFLDAELNAAYRMLLAHLQEPARAAMVESQRRWLRYRQAEFHFIARHWTQDRSGTSASLSAAGHRNGLTRERIVQLLRYAAEYP